MVHHADLWLRPKPGTDVAWINGVLHVILKETLYDEEYVNSRTTGLDDLKKISLCSREIVQFASSNIPTFLF